MIKPDLEHVVDYIRRYPRVLILRKLYIECEADSDEDRQKLKNLVDQMTPHIPDAFKPKAKEIEIADAEADVRDIQKTVKKLKGRISHASNKRETKKALCSSRLRAAKTAQEEQALVEDAAGQTQGVCGGSEEIKQEIPV